MTLVWKPMHLGPERASTDRHGNVLVLFAACGEEEPERLMAGDVDAVECDRCLDYAAANPEEYDLTSCPTVGDVVEETDATREVVLAVTGFYLSARRVTGTLPDRGDAVIVLSPGEKEDLVEEILAHVDEEVDE